MRLYVYLLTEYWAMFSVMIMNHDSQHKFQVKQMPLSV